MKLQKLAIFYTVSLLIFSGCALPKPNGERVVDSTLPTIDLTENGVFVDMNAVAFEWRKIEDRRVKGVYIYKQTIDKDGKQNSDIENDYYDSIDNSFTTHYVDSKITPNTQYNYAFKTYSADGESVSSKVVSVTSLPPLDSVSWIHGTGNMPRSAKIIWRPHPNEKVKAYILERSTLEEPKWDKLTTIYGRLNAEYIDKKLQDNHAYKYRIRVVTFDDITSEPSEEVSIITKPLPDEVTEIEATKDLPQKIRVTWAKTNTADFLNYNIYRSESINSGYKLITKTQENSFVDDIPEDGKNYFYRVSAVDKDLLESMHEKHSIQGMTLAKPTAPALFDAKLINDEVKLRWSSSDTRIKSFIVTKTIKKGWFDSKKEEFVDISGNSFVDSAIEPETTYFYFVQGIDENAIKSNPSIEVKFTTTKTQGKVLNTNDFQEKVNETNVNKTPKQTESTVSPVQDIYINEN